MIKGVAMRGISKTLPIAALAALLAVLPAGAADEDVRVSLCDGRSVMSVPGLKPGELLSPDKARQLAAEMMQIWRGSQGEARWAAWTAEASAAQAAAPAAAQEGQPTKFTKRDELTWKREQDKWIAEGYKNYHNAQALGGTIGISCDMCHPDGSNTHPETYPKFQTQTKKVALLRDMINWCIENPLKGKPLPEDDARLRSMEAYILSTRKGVALAPGKHSARRGSAAPRELAPAPRGPGAAGSGTLPSCRAARRNWATRAARIVHGVVVCQALVVRDRPRREVAIVR
jgi:thiosulfate dehydrogenase